MFSISKSFTKKRWETSFYRYLDLNVVSVLYLRSPDWFHFRVSLQVFCGGNFWCVLHLSRSQSLSSSFIFDEDWDKLLSIWFSLYHVDYLIQFLLLPFTLMTISLSNYLCQYGFEESISDFRVNWVRWISLVVCEED